MKTFIKKNLIKIAIGIVAVLTIVGAGLSYYNNIVMKRALLVKVQSTFALQAANAVYDNIRLMDISARGYYIIRKPEYLFWSVETANRKKKEIFRILDSILLAQNYPNPVNYKEVQEGFASYTAMYEQMVKHLHAKEDSQYVALLAEDRGRFFWDVANPFQQDINAFEEKNFKMAEQLYQSAATRNIVVQMLLILIGLPTLGFALYTLVKDEYERKKLLLDVAENNNKYLFNDGREFVNDGKTILGKLILYLQRACGFVNEISLGNFDAKWEGLNQDNVINNQNNLAGRLMYMRDEMKKAREDDLKRIWTTEGLSEFSQIIRKNQNNLNDLTNKAVTFLIRYTKSLQGSLFVLEKDDEGQSYLKISACYAFDQEMNIKKRINIGEGMVGQVYLEGKTVVLKSIPQGFVSINSGLGQATPNCVTIIPVKYNDRVLAILELASFSAYDETEINFLEKSGEFIATAIATMQRG